MFRTTLKIGIINLINKSPRRNDVITNLTGSVVPVLVLQVIYESAEKLTLHNKPSFVNVKDQ